MAKNHNGGFTLIETLVALVIFSVMVAGFGRYVQDQAAQMSYLADKTLAAIIASNTLDEMRISPWPLNEQSTRKVTMAQRDWKVDIDVQKTSSDNLERMDVSVAKMEAGSDSSTPPLATMTGFIGRH